MTTQTTATKPAKWFYPYQDKIKNRIESAGYSLYGYCHWQNESEGRYSECWDVQNNETGKCEQVIAVANKFTKHIFFYTSVNNF